MSKILGILLLAIGLIQCQTLSSSLTYQEQHKLLQKINEAPKDLASVFYSVSSLTALGKEITDKDALCKFAGEKLDTKKAESLFQFSEVARLCGCKNIPQISSLTEIISDATSAVEFSQVVAALRNFGNEVDSETLKKFVNLLKENDNPLSAGAAFYTASLLPKSDILKPIVSMVEDIVAQADEIGGEILQFEGGLSVTADVVNGIMRLSDQQGTKLMKDDQVTKFTQYFLSRKFVFTLKDIHYLLSALSALSNNKNQVPVVVSVYKSNQITKENPMLKVRVTNLLDRAIPDAKVTAKSLKTADESVTLFDNKPFVKAPNNKEDMIVIDNEVARGYIEAHAFDLDIMAANPKRGMFKCNVAVQLKGKQFIKKAGYEVSLKVLARVMVENAKIFVGEKDQASSASTPLKYPNQMPAIEADSHQKIVMEFDLKDLNSGESVTAHQTFIRLTNVETQQEIFFVAEPNSDDHYTFTLNIHSTAKDSFNYQSGKYKMALVVGDATMQVPISWSLGEVTLKFTGTPASSKRQERLTKPQPNIDHMFRIPEKRPPKIVSTVFTFLVLSPLLLMFVLWAKIGANLSNFNFSISTILFHIGLACIFALYYMFWVKLNMFQTLKLLAVIGGVTFLGGNKMLADIAASKYKS